MRSESARISSSASETSSTAPPRSRNAAIRRWMKAVPGDVDAARRLRGDEELRRALEFARDREALLVAAGKAAGRIARARRSAPTSRVSAFRASARSPRGAASPKRENDGSRSRPATKLSRSEAVRQSPSSARSALTIADSRPRGTARSRAPVRFALAKRDRPCDRRARGRRRRRRARPVRCRRLPATPTISPRRDVEVDRTEPLEAERRRARRVSRAE